MGKGLENRVGLAWAMVGMLAWGVYMHVHLVGWKLVSLVEMQQALCDAAGAEKVPKH